MTSAPREARAQFTFATDNSGNYSGSFIGADQGSGFQAWTAAGTGAGGSYIGGSGLSSSSWAIFSGGGSGNSYNAYRKSEIALSVGDRWATDFGYTGVNQNGTIGINFYSGGSFRFSLQFTGGGSFWQIKDSDTGNYFNTTLGWAGGSPGTTLSFSIERGTNNNYSLNLVQGASSYNATNFTGGATYNFDEIQFYSVGQGGGQNVGFNNLRITNSGVFVMGGSVTSSNTFTGSGVMSVGSNTVLHLSQTGNTFTGGVTISNGSTLRAASLGTGTINLSGTLATFDGTARTFTNSTVLGNANVQLGDATGTGALTLSNINLGTNTRNVTVSNSTTIAGALSQGSFTKAGTGTLALLSAAGANFTNTTLSAGTLRISNATALGTGTFTVSGANSVLSALTTMGINNAVVANADFQLGEAATGTGALTLSNTFNLGTNTRTLNVSNATTISGQISQGNLVKAGTGTLVLLSAAGSNFTNTTLSAGVLRVGDATALGSGTFTMSGGIFASDSGTARTIANALTIGGDVIFGDGTGTGALTFSSTATNALGGGTRSLTTAVDTTIAGALGGGNITKEGSGTLYLTNANSSFGTLTVNNGRVTFQTNATITGLAGSGSGSLALAGGTLTANIGSADNSFGQVITGAGNLTKAGAGTLRLTGTSSTYTGPTTILGGLLAINGDGSLGTAPSSPTAGMIVISNATLGFNGSFQLNSNRGMTLNTAGTLNVFDGNTVTNNAIIAESGTATLTKSGGGTLILGGSNSYTGNTTIGTGALRATHANAFGTGGTVSVSSGAALQLSNNITVTRALTLNGDGVTAGSGSLRNMGGTNTWSGGISNASGARINVDAGTLTVSGNITNADTTLFVGGVSNSTFSGTITGARTAGDGALFKDGAGTLTLGGNNSDLSGNITLRAGTLRATNGGALGSGTIQLGNGTTTTTLLIETNMSRAGGIAFSNNSTAAVINVASGQTFTNSGGLSQVGGTANTNKFGKDGAGTLVLAGSSTYAGQIQIGQGTVILGTANALGVNTDASSARAIDLGLNIGDTSTANNVALLISNGLTLSNSIYVAANTSSATRTVGLAGTGSMTISNQIYMDGTLTVDAGSSASDSVSIVSNIANTGGIIKTNAGILVLSASNSHSGGTTLGQGTLRAGNNNALGTGGFTINGGTFASTSGDARTITNAITMGGNNVTFGDATGTGNLTLSNINLAQADRTFAIGNNTTIAGVISNGGATAAALTKLGAGTLTLSGNNTFTGALTIGGGVVSVANNGNLGGGSAMTISNGAQLVTTGGFTSTRALTIGDGGGQINVATNTTFTSTGPLSGATALTKTGTGTLALSNTSSSYNGTVALTAGTLQVNGTASNMAVNITNTNSVLMGAGSIGSVTVNSGTRIAPGNSVGNLSVSALTLEGGGGYNWEITAATGAAGTDWDLITVGGGSGIVTLTNATTLNPFTIFVQGNPSGWNVNSNYSWTIINAGTIHGFASDAFTVNLGAFTGATPTGSFSFSNVSGDLIMAYSAPLSVYNVTVTTGAVDQGAGAGITGGTNQFSGDSALNKLGAGTLIMTNQANNYTGVTTIREGTIQINVNAPNNAAGALGTANTAVVIGDTTTNVAAGFNFGVAGITNSRGLSVVAGTGAADRVIGTTITSGVAEQAGTVAVNTNTTFSAAGGGTLLVSGAISQSGNITISNSGTNIFSAANTYNGTTTILTNATLIIANNSALGATNATTTVNNGGTLALSNNISTAENITIAGSGGTNADGALRNLSGANTNTGTITLSANATIAADSGTSLQLGNINNGATTNGLSLSTASNSTILLTGNISNTDTNTTIFKTGTGSLVISNGAANNTAGAQLQVAAGTVTLASGTFSTNTSAARRALDLGLNPDNSGSTNSAAFFVNSGVTFSNTIYVAPGTGARTLGTESTSGTATFGGEIYLENGLNLSAALGANAAFTGNLINTGNITKVGAGTVTLSGNNTVVGSVNINAGTLTVSGSSAINDSSAVTIASNAVFNLSANETVGSIAGQGDITLGGQLIAGGNGTPTDFSGVMSGSGAFVKTGSGTLTLSGANNYSGQTFLVGGTTLFTAAQGTAFANTINLAETNGTASVTMALGGSGLNMSNAIVVRAGSSGNTIAIDARNAAGTTNTLSGAISLNTNATVIATNGGALNLTGSAMSFANSTTLTVTNSANVAITGQIAALGDALIAKRGTGTLTLSGGNTSGSMRFDLYGGELRAASTGDLGNNTGDFMGNKLYFDGGRLAVGGNITLGGANGITLGSGGGTIRVDPGNTLTLQGFINDSSNTGVTLSKTGAGTLFFDKTGINDFNGTTIVVNEGTLSTWNPGLLSPSVQLGATNGATAGTYRFDKSDGGVTATNNFVMNTGGGIIEVTADTLTNTGVVSGSGAFTKTGAGTLVLAASNFHSGGINVSAGALSVSAASQLGTSNNALNLNGGTLLSTASFDLGASRTLNIGLAGGTLFTATNTTLTFNGAITNASTNSTLTKLGAGTLSLGSGSGLFTGNTTVGQGVLLLTTNTALSQSFVTVSNGAVLTNNFSNQTIDIGDLQGAGTVNAGSNSVTVGSEGNNTTFSGQVNISGNNNFTAVGSGTLTLSGKISDTQTGSTVVGAGAVQLSGTDNRFSTNAALAVSNGAILDLNGLGQRVAGLSGTGTITNSPATSGRLTVNVASSANTFSGTMQGGMDFEKTGAGTMVLAGNNGFAGAVRVLGGTLSVGADNNFGNATNVVTLSNNTAAVSFSSSFSSSRNFTVATGTTGTLLAGSGLTTTLGGSLSKNGSVLVFGGGGSFIVNGVISGDSANSDLVVSNSTVTLNAANTYSGPTYVHSGGTLNVGINNAMPTDTALYLGTNTTSGTVNLQGFNQTVASLQTQGTGGTNNVVALGGGTLTVNGSSSSTYAGLISGAGSVVKSGTGTLALTAANTYSGSTTISNGTLQISLIANGGAASSIGSGTTITMAGANATNAVVDYTGGNVTTDRAFVMDNGGGTINMTSSTTEMTLTGSASGSGKLIVGEGTLILNGATNAFAPGSIQVDSGATLQLAANNQIGDTTGLILNGGTFRVGTASTGFSDTLGTLTLSASSTIDLGAWTTGVRQLTFANSSAITWTGTLTITNWQGVALQSSSVAEILFGTGGLTSAQLGQVYWANQNINGGTLIGGELVPVPEPRVYAAAVALLAVVGWRERKRLREMLTKGLAKKSATPKA